MPLIGVIAVGVIGEVKRNERAKKEDTTVHYTPAAAKKMETLLPHYGEVEHFIVAFRVSTNLEPTFRI